MLEKKPCFFLGGSSLDFFGSLCSQLFSSCSAEGNVACRHLKSLGQDT